MATLAERMEALGGDVYSALEKLRVPVFVIDGSGVLVYGNAAATDRFGEVRGRRFTSFVAPDSVAAARDAFARKMVGTEDATERRVTMIARDGTHVPAEVSTVALRRDDRVVGVFGLADLRDTERPLLQPASVHLTPRQAETLRHLAAGCTTRQMADLMGISVDTVRNHVRALLRRLGAHSRLEAIVRAHELGLLS